MTTEVIEEMKQFQLYVPFTRNQHSVEFSKNYTENENGTLTIEGIASTINKDLQGDIILPSAIRSMKKQLLTTTKNLHGDHRYGLDGIYGAIKEVLDSEITFNRTKKITNNVDTSIEYSVGEKVKHEEFGEGVIVSVEKSILTIAFPHPYGIKMIMKGHKSIKKIGGNL